MAYETVDRPVVYEILPMSAADTWKLRNVTSGRDVVRGISKDGCIRLKRQLEMNRQVRLDSMEIRRKQNRHEG